jgi:hypothetical protein
MIASAASQSELSPLERGMHALKATVKGSKTGRSVKAYAEAIGRRPPTVFSAVVGQPITAKLWDRATHLAAIHTAALAVAGAG